MPAVRPTAIVQAVIDSLDEGGASAILLSNERGNPRRFIVQHGRSTFELWVYIWTLTHGGGSARPHDEYRIQITGVQSPIIHNPQGQTVLLGYEPNTHCFAGFDIRKHQTFSTRSPSIQVPISVLYDALQQGHSFSTKGNDEIAIGVRSDQFLSYCLNAEVLHSEGANVDMVDLLTKAASLQEIAPIEVEQITTERGRILREVSQLSRDASFRRKVIHAYDKRCAVTRMQLRLIDAAHILPVGAPESSDHVVNGICLSPTYHRAFDRALIFLDDHLQMQINHEKEQELIAAGVAGGLADFSAYLGKRIHLPADRNQWPDLELIHTANRFRGIS